MMWIFAADWIEPALAALLVIVLMLWTGVLSWSDITNNKAAWNTFVWFATLVALADGLSSTGFIAWLGKEGGALMSGISPGVRPSSCCWRSICCTTCSPAPPRTLPRCCRPC